MINVSLNDLMVGNELPAPRTAARPEASAFAALMGETGQRQDAATSDRARDRIAETRDAARAPVRNTTSNERRDSDARAVRNATSNEHRDFDKPAAQTAAEPTRSDATPEPRQSTTAAEKPATSNTKSTDTDSDTATAEPSPKTASSDSPDRTPDNSGQAAESPDIALGLIIPQTVVPPQSPLPVVATPDPVSRSATAAVPASQAANTHVPEHAGPIAPPAANPAAPPAATPAVPPTPFKFDDAGKPTLGAPSSAQGNKPADAPIALPTAAGKPFTDTLFAATLLSQSAMPERIILSPPGANPQAGPLAETAVTAAPATDKPLANTLPLDQEPTATARMRASQIVVAAQSDGPSTKTSLLSQQTAHLSALLDAQNIDLQIRQIAEPAPGKPVPALANGMAAQITQPQQATSQSQSGASATGPVDGQATANAATTQTAIAVAAAPVAQLVADEPRPKFTANQDGMAINAQAPIGGPRAAPGAIAEQAAPAKFTVPTQPATDQVAVHIAKAAAEGSDKISIKLKPASLGQIEVHLEVAADGRVHAVIAADKPETLDLLQRDARGLERALNDAGLRTDSGSLSFNLRGQGQPFGGSSGNGTMTGGFGSSAERAAPEADLLGNASRIGAYLNSRAAAGGVDIRV